MDEKGNNNLKDKVEKKKTCFIITPIGDDGSPIRRHAEGVIDGAIVPIVKDKFGYDIIVAHRINKTGSINKQVIHGIFKADIVIANLTILNPNVMYELAFAHSIGKPTIMIAEKGNTKLPFDITEQRTIFYINDLQGTIELKENLENAIIEIEKNIRNAEIVDNPIYSWIGNALYEENVINNIAKGNNIETDNVDMLKLILERLDNIESRVNYSTSIKNSIKISERFRSVRVMSEYEEEFKITLETFLKNKLNICVSKFQSSYESVAKGEEQYVIIDIYFNMEDLTCDNIGRIESYIKVALASVENKYL
ncbi:TPA: hypothetical protein KO297_002748 [Clostridioides difficile]|nr:hypothetical protein [Clostridioides difficile]